MSSGSSTDVLESSTQLDNMSGSSDSDADILQQSRQSNNREDEEDEEARITRANPTLQENDTKLVTQSKSMWTTGKESDDESNEFSAAESFDDEDDDGNIFDDDDEVPIAHQEEPKRDSAPTLSRTKSGTLASLPARQQQVEISDDEEIEEIEELDESIDEEDDDDEDEVVGRTAQHSASTASGNKSLFTRVEPRSVPAQQARAVVEEDVRDEYEDDNFEEEDEEANITAYKNPGDMSGSASDEIFSVGEDSDIDDSVVSF
jgi:hypothetical protein